MPLRIRKLLIQITAADVLKGRDIKLAIWRLLFVSKLGHSLRIVQKKKKKKKFAVFFLKELTLFISGID